jgi:hypothetical protein
MSHKWLRVFLTNPRFPQAYDDPEGLIKVLYKRQPHIELYSESETDQAMHLIRQAYDFRRSK